MLWFLRVPRAHVTMLSSDIAYNDFALLVPGEGGNFPLGFAHSSRSKIAGVFDLPLRCNCNAVPFRRSPRRRPMHRLRGH
jgi:hypothetical protein